MIKIRGARQHNLKNIDVDLPRGKLIAVTGLSGSGKSTLAFDILYAEGQRRYVESLSPYARQFLERLAKPDVDLIDGLSPTIAIEQKTGGHNPRSTVGTVTEIHDYLRLLFARAGTVHCHKCGQVITSQSIDQIIEQLIDYPPGTRMIILSPLVSSKKGDHAPLLRRLEKNGFARVRVNGIIQELHTVKALPKNKPHSIEVVVDRLIIKPDLRNRLADSLELALSLSQGRLFVALSGQKDAENASLLHFSEHAACHACGVRVAERTPAHFSFNTPKGACPRCDGLGVRSQIDPDLIVPDPELSLKNGAVSIWSNRNTHHHIRFVKALCDSFGADMAAPFHCLPDALRQALLFGTGDRAISFSVEHNKESRIYNRPFEGIVPRLERRYRTTESAAVREDIEQYMTVTTCPACNGARLRPESLSVTVNGRGIHELSTLPIDELRLFFKPLVPEGQKAAIANRIIHEILQRLDVIKDVGLGYLTLDRAANTLSGGESQRIRLATQIGSNLSGILYVIDEPSIGLHQRDNRKLLLLLSRLRDTGNTVLVVEHEHETIAAADYVIDMGPGAGLAGGHVVFAGPPQALTLSETSLTGRYLSGRLQIPLPKKRRQTNGRAIAINGASQHNLKHIDVSFPLGCLVCVTGVSGSGKSTLVIETLYRSAKQHLYRSTAKPGRHDAISGLSRIDKVINMDQSPIGKTPRSNPATYTGVFSFIRELLAKTPQARARGFTAGRFSFNNRGGRCETCAGEGAIRIEMHFLPDLYAPCDICLGKRYNRETLDICYKGRNVAQILELTIEQALVFFKNVPVIRDKLQTLVDVGLGYVRLGQPAVTLSGGEAQRIKLARELGKRATGSTLYIFDEPTTGLHMDDINRLLVVINRLVDNGNTVIVIEHNLDVVKTADYVIDLGPEGGDGGGFVMAAGTPEQIAEVETSHTGFFLRKKLLVQPLRLDP